MMLAGEKKLSVLTNEDHGPNERNQCVCVCAAQRYQAMERIISTHKTKNALHL